MRIDGGCHCGRVTYEAEIDPEMVGVYHCTDCQTLSGTAYRASVAAAADNFSLKGKPKSYVKIAESGNRRVQAFCPECGTPIYSTGAESPKFYNIRLGTVRQRRDLPPKQQSWCRSILPWVEEVPSLTRIEKE